MGELVSFSPSSSILLPCSQIPSSKQQLPIGHDLTSSLAVISPMCFLSTKHTNSPTTYAVKRSYSWRIRAIIDADSLSQNLTLGYAALVGIGGLVGYLKGGSQKSLVAGGASAALLYYVYNILPSNPVLASSLGFGLSASLLGVMGLRFKKTGKFFPAGIVFLVALIMSGGYLHGILRSLPK